VNLDKLLDRIPHWLGSKVNTLIGLALFVFLVALPLIGIHVSDHAELIGGNFTNVAGYLGASIAAGASVVNLHEGRSHRKRSTERLDAIHEHLTKPTPPRTGRTRKEPAP
jgi:hypothetical protein